MKNAPAMHRRSCYAPNILSFTLQVIMEANIDKTEKRCYYCDFCTVDMNDFIPHYEQMHFCDTIKIKIPFHDIASNKRKYSLMNYSTSISKFDPSHKLVFDKDLNLKQYEENTDQTRTALQSCNT